MNECRFCANPETEQWIDKKGKTYHYCSGCGIIQLDPVYFLSPAEEQERYLKHNNTPENKGYITYLNDFIDTAVIPFVKPGGEILNFGSGPVPVLSNLLTSRGFFTQSYDPIFNDITNWEDKSYDAVVAVEVFEHLHHPEKVIPLIQKALKPEGNLILRTLLHKEDYNLFIKWWYREDKTHVTFYSEKTIEHICSRWNFILTQIEDNCEIILRK